MNISVVGLGKLGTPLAAVFASKGHHVIGVDVSERTVQAINDGRSVINEPGLADLIARHRQSLSATTDIGEAVAGTDATFILVPAPSGADGLFSANLVLAAATHIGRGLARKSSYHLVVVVSTLTPGTTGGEILPLLERESGKECGRDFGLCCCPE